MAPRLAPRLPGQSMRVTALNTKAQEHKDAKAPLCLRAFVSWCLTAVLAFILSPLPGHGQSTLDFPRAIQPSQLGTSGFAIVNPGSSAAEVRFTLYDMDGSPEQVSNQTIPARGQLSKSGNELFAGAEK